MSENGTLQTVGGLNVVRFERALAHPVEVVWAAITEPARLEHWFPTTVEGERATGATVDFKFRDPAEAQWNFSGTILEYRPTSVFELRWGPESLRFQLTPTETGTLLTFTTTFDDERIVARDTAGWHVCLDELVSHLSGGAASAPSTEVTPGWQSYFDQYREAFGERYAAVSQATAME